MTSKRADWPILRNTVIGFGICVLAAAGMLSASHYFKQSMEREYQISHNRFRNASQQYLAVDEEERIIEEYYPQFVRLFRDGKIGSERRLNWLETLRSAGNAIKIPQLSYKIDAQQEFQPDYALGLGDYKLYASPMSLSLGLLHEGDLLRLLAALERDADGQYSVQKCDLRRAENGFELDPARANIEAECTLEWLTINLSGDHRLAL